MKTFISEPVDYETVRDMKEKVEKLFVLTTQTFSINKTLSGRTESGWTSQVTVPDGYHLLAITGIQYSGTNSGYIKSSHWHTNGTNGVYILFRNDRSASATFNVTLNLLFVRSDCFSYKSYL